MGAARLVRAVGWVLVGLVALFGAQLIVFVPEASACLPGFKPKPGVTNPTDNARDCEPEGAPAGPQPLPGETPAAPEPKRPPRPVLVDPKVPRKKVEDLLKRPPGGAGSGEQPRPMAPPPAKADDANERIKSIGEKLKKEEEEGRQLDAAAENLIAKLLDGDTVVKTESESLYHDKKGKGKRVNLHTNSGAVISVEVDSQRRVVKYEKYSKLKEKDRAKVLRGEVFDKEIYSSVEFLRESTMRDPTTIARRTVHRPRRGAGDQLTEADVVLPEFRTDFIVPEGGAVEETASEEDAFTITAERFRNGTRRIIKRSKGTNKVSQSRLEQATAGASGDTGRRIEIFEPRDAYPGSKRDVITRMVVDSNGNLVHWEEIAYLPSEKQALTEVQPPATAPPARPQGPRQRSRATELALEIEKEELRAHNPFAELDFEGKSAADFNRASGLGDLPDLPPLPRGGFKEAVAWASYVHKTKADSLRAQLREWQKATGERVEMSEEDARELEEFRRSRGVPPQFRH